MTIRRRLAALRTTLGAGGPRGVSRIRNVDGAPSTFLREAHLRCHLGSAFRGAIFLVTRRRALTHAKLACLRSLPGAAIALHDDRRAADGRAGKRGIGDVRVIATDAISVLAANAAVLRVRFHRPGFKGRVAPSVAHQHCPVVTMSCRKATRATGIWPGDDSPVGNDRKLRLVKARDSRRRHH